jgi:hypothetical protein
MHIKTFVSIIFCMLSALLIGCTTDKGEDGISSIEYVPAYIVGSAENPDPVLERVLELERQGLIINLFVMESFPVQIKFDAPRKVIEELEFILRKKKSY